MKIGVLVADGCQDSEYFLPKIEIEKVGVATEGISLTRAPVEIFSFFTRIGLLDVQKTVDEVNPADYAGVLVPGGAKSPAILCESGAALRFLRERSTVRTSGSRRSAGGRCSWPTRAW
jgi:deglycase